MSTAQPLIKGTFKPAKSANIQKRTIITGSLFTNVRIIPESPDITNVTSNK